MADIVKFQCISGGTPDTSSLQSDEPVLLFTTTAEGQIDMQMGRLSTRPPKASRPLIRDWGNQELADLFRVKQLLDAAGIACEIDRGVTDDGDPWFVFCRSDGDVFAHFCRIDGIYILDSPTIQRPLRGRDFNGLINDFTGLSKTASGSPLDRDDETTHRVVHLSRNSTVRLHPSAILAALIWTFLLSSEELILVRPSDESDPSSEGLNGLFPSDNNVVDGTGLAPTMAEAEAVAPETLKAHDAKALEKLVADDAENKSTQYSQSISAVPNHTAMALSALAINMGFLSEALLSEKYDDLLAEVETPGVLEAALRTQAAQLADQQQAANAHLGALHEGVAPPDADAKIDLAALKGRGPSTHHVADTKASDSSFKLSLEPGEAIPFFADSLQRDVPFIFKTDLKTRSEVPESHLETPDQPKSAVAADLSTFIDLSDVEDFGDILHAITEIWRPVLREYKFEEMTVQSSFDITEDIFEDGGLLDLTLTETDQGAVQNTPRTVPSSGASAGSADLPAGEASYNDEARKYIDYILSTSPVDIIYLEDHLILIDLDVLDNPSAPRSIHTWTFDDGGSISLIGLQSEYGDYLMHA